MLTNSCRRFDSLGRLVLRKAAAIRPSVVTKLWRQSTLGLLSHIELQRVNV